VPNLLRSRLVGVTGCLLGAFPGGILAWQPGNVVEPPTRMPSHGFTVDTSNRNDVVAFWHAIYQASEGYEKRVQWTGNYQGDPGRVSDDFADDVERRINFFRAMCGLPASVRVNTGSKVVIDPVDAHKPPPKTQKSEAVQSAALMLIQNYNPSTGSDPAITHDPPSSLVGWSTSAWNANAKGNLAFGVYGPGAITEYMIEELASGSATSVWNTLVGHRRWTLFPPATDFATGDQPGQSATRPPTNVLYVTQKDSELVPPSSSNFVAYPPPGFFPAQLNSRFWSLSREGADFSSATVQVTDSDGNPVVAGNIRSNLNYGDPALLWEVAGAAAAKSAARDSTFNVHVTGIGGTGIPGSFSYSVTFMDPNRSGARRTLKGISTAPTGQTTSYHFKPAKETEALRVTTFQRSASPWTEGAEAPSSPTILDGTADSYPLQANMASFSGFGQVYGLRAFHLTFPTSYDLLLRGVPEQTFELDREIIAKAGAKFKFLYRRGFMTTDSHLVIEISMDGGISWKRTGRTISGISNTSYGAAALSATYDLPKSADPIRIRFRYFTTPGKPIYTHESSPSSPSGIFIDEITTSHCDWLKPENVIYLPKTAKKFDFNSSSAGAPLTQGSDWRLQLEYKLGGKWFAYGPMKTVRIAAP
jgi:hypothetical protein